jgi:hypothetical protein
MRSRNDKTVYLMCPAVGHPEAPRTLHQLGRVLLDLGHDARMVYAAQPLNPQRVDRVLRFPAIAASIQAYESVPQATEVEDRSGNIIVFPEIWPEITHLVSAMTPYMWWLHVDGGLRAVEGFGGVKALQATRCVHLSQSHYAETSLAQHGISALPLSDYTIEAHIPVGTGPRARRVLYSERGRPFTHGLRRWAPWLDWHDISGLAAAEVERLFKTSRLYVDFGDHPGKDRLPREAAIHGCCVITGHRGAAGLQYADVPIPLPYKFRDSRLLAPRIVWTIQRTLADYDRRVADFAAYRRIIQSEKATFIAQATRIFGGDTLPPA